MTTSNITRSAGRSISSASSLLSSTNSIALSSSSSSSSPCRCFSSTSSSKASTPGSMPEVRSSRSDSARTSAGNPNDSAAGGRRRTAGGPGGRGGSSRPARRTAALPPYEEWIKGQGADLYKNPPPGKGPHWISDTPFPLNPSFLPPAPLSQKGRDELWNQHTSNSKQNGVKELSRKFSISPARIEAILRLKALETEWQQQGKPLQTEFTKNMDRLLGSPSLPHAIDPKSPSNLVSTTPETNEAISPRGSIIEEFPESGSEASVLEPAMMEAQEKQKQRVKDLPTGGPSVEAAKSAEQQTTKISSRVALNPKNIERPTLVVSNLSVGLTRTQARAEGRPEVRSYEGAGRLARNERRAEKRKTDKKRSPSEKLDPVEAHSRAEMESSG